MTLDRRNVGWPKADVRQSPSQRPLSADSVEKRGGLRGMMSLDSVLMSSSVRRQSFWDSERLHLREALARLVDDAMRLAGDAATVGLRWSVV